MPFLLPCKQQELPARVNFSAAPAPAPAVPTALNTKMDELEGQLLAKVLALEKERVALSHNSQRQRQQVEKELDALQDRVAGLEHGRSRAQQRALSQMGLQGGRFTRKYFCALQRLKLDGTVERGLQNPRGRE